MRLVFIFLVPTLFSLVVCQPGYTYWVHPSCDEIDTRFSAGFRDILDDAIGWAKAAAYGLMNNNPLQKEYYGRLFSTEPLDPLFVQHLEKVQSKLLPVLSMMGSRQLTCIRDLRPSTVRNRNL